MSAIPYGTFGFCLLCETVKGGGMCRRKGWVDGEASDTPEEAVKSAIAEAKAEGWQPGTDGEWLCKDCAVQREVAMLGREKA